MKVQAFTVKYNGIARVLQSDIWVSQVNESDHSKILQSKAIWDTGATNCTITHDFAQAIGLIPMAKTKVAGVHGSKEVNVYLIDLFLPNHVRVPAVRVTECATLSGEATMLIGMDIITLGDFAISNKKNQTCFTFRIPSQNEFNFVPKANVQNLINTPRIVRRKK